MCHTNNLVLCNSIERHHTTTRIHQDFSNNTPKECLQFYPSMNSYTSTLYPLKLTGAIPPVSNEAPGNHLGNFLSKCSNFGKYILYPFLTIVSSFSGDNNGVQDQL